LDLKMFRLHEKLDEDCLLVGQFDLSLLLISRDANYPWLILVPKREKITEIFQLEPQDRQQLLEESCILSQAMTELFAPDKLNIAALGNVVPQLHVHHIARYHSDPSWPKPIWGVVPADNYDPDMLSARCENLRQRLKNRGFR
jgi:diadenosine tetraphosphate (Ap4A) HIT family hydrolase